MCICICAPVMSVTVQTLKLFIERGGGLWTLLQRKTLSEWSCVEWCGGHND